MEERTVASCINVSQYSSGENGQNVCMDDSCLEEECNEELPSLLGFLNVGLRRKYIFTWMEINGHKMLL